MPLGNDNNARYGPAKIILGLFLTIILAFCARMLEWPIWENPEYSFRNEMLLATHDAYHWVAGAYGFGAAVGHPMAEMLKIMAEICHCEPVAVAFWFPAILASLVGGLVFLWAAGFGCLQAGMAAGLIATISPGFLGRTLLGFYDTDLVTLFFPLLIALAPAIWCQRYLVPLPQAFNVIFKNHRPEIAYSNPDSPVWICLFALSGLVACFTQQWHSVFPYLIRFNVFLLGLFILILGARGMRWRLAITGLAYAFPAALGYNGLVYVLAALLARCPRFVFLRKIFFCPYCDMRLKIPLNGEASSPRGIFAGGFDKQSRHSGLGTFIPKPQYIISALWLAALACLIQGEIFDTFLYQINAYLKHSGDAHSSGAASLVFPSVAQSIIEVQDLTFTALFPYFHPWLEAAFLGFLGFFAVMYFRPGAIFLLPLLCLGILSSRLGGRMVMFGAPIVALGISLPVYWIISRLAAKKLGHAACGWLACGLLCAALVAPFLDMIPSLSQGPILNRRHAEALAQAGAITPKDAALWLWWDWGYAAHYFARRQTIADGARHGGPSLYLPAAVFATDNARFARQIIRYASTRDNEPGNFFRDLGAPEAQELINKLRSAETPLVQGAGKQYVIVSFEMLKLGFWISNFGNWNFVTKEGEGGALSIIPEAVAYKLNAGEVRLEGSPSIIFPTSINIFAETGVTRRNYVEEWFAAHPRATSAEQKAWLASRRNINFLFNRVTDEKLAVDQGIYNSLMAQLLLCEANDPRFSPYFRLVYDNVFTRIYEVLP